MTKSLMKKHPTLKRQIGFTLLELSIVLAIMGLIIAGGLTILTTATKSAQYNQTVARMDEINKALLDYTVVFNRLPCPADLTIAADTTNYGTEAASNGNTCYGGTPSANFKAASTIVEGAVPVRTLKLPDSYMYDNWGHKFRYAVDPTKTAASAFPTSAGLCYSGSAITIKDANGVTPRSSNASYALISSGADGHGGYTRNGVMFNGGSTNTDELANCHCDSNAASTTYSGIYIQKLPTSSMAATDVFDDIVNYREAWQLQSSNVSLGSTSCTYYVWVADNVNNRVMKFDSSGNYITAAGSGYNGSPGAKRACVYTGGTGQMCSPQGVTTDSSGNVYVVDHGNNTIKKYDYTGTYVSDLVPATSGSANGKMINPSSIAMDASGNFWVGDDANYRLQQFSSAGAWMRSRGDNVPHTCETSPNSSQPACANGQGSGQYGATSYAITADKKTGAVFVSDPANYRVQKLDSTGAFVSQFPCAGGACASNSTGGTVNAAWGIDVDANSNIWITDNTNARVQKLDSSGNFILQFPCASGTCSTGSTNGIFATYSADLIKVAPDGSIWVGDDNNSRVQKFSYAGTYLGQAGCGGTGGCGTSTTDGLFGGPPEGIAFSTK